MMHPKIGSFSFLIFVPCDKCQHVFYSLVKHAFIQLAAFKSVHDPFAADSRISGHFKVKSRTEHFETVMGCAPVGHHQSLEAPFIAQNVGKQPLVFSAVFTVDFIVSAHHRFGICILHNHFKGLQIDLPNGAHIGNTIAHKAVALAVVQREMLYRYADAFALNSLNLGSSHFACEIRIFGKILEASAAERISLDIDGGAEHHVNAVMIRFRTDRFSHLICIFGIPA